VKEIQILHKGKVLHGRVGFDMDFMEVDLMSPATFSIGDKVL
jgi:hypothetical protein